MMNSITLRTGTRTVLLATAILLLMTPTRSAGGPCDCASCQQVTSERQRCYCCVYHGVGGKRSVFDVSTLSSSVSPLLPPYRSALESFLHRSKSLHIGQGQGQTAATARGRTTSASRRASPGSGWQETPDILEGGPYPQTSRGNHQDEVSRFRYDRPLYVREIREGLKRYAENHDDVEKFENFLTSDA